MIRWEESCLSVPEFDLNVDRHHRIHMRWVDVTGAPHQGWFEEFSAVVLQHEAVHLEGVTLLDHSSRLKLYQFIHQNEQGLVPGLFLHLANRLNLPAEKGWQTDPRAIAVRNVFDFYFQTYLPAKRKKPLLNGNDIQDISKIKPSPTFATILYKIEEARVLGIINTRSQAISFAKNIVRKTQKETN